MPLSRTLTSLRKSLRVQLENVVMALPSRKIKSNKNLVAIWTAPRITNNVGDRALTEGSLALIPASNVALICRDGEEYQDKIEKLFLFPQSAEAGTFADFVKYMRRFKREIGSCSAVLIVGADIMDGKYGDRTSTLRWKLAGWLASKSVDTSLFSMSWNERPTSAALGGAKAACSAGVKIFARDELSLSRLHNSGITAQLASDVSFLRTDQQQPNLQVQEKFSDSAKNVLVNVSDWVTDNEEMFDLIVAALSSLPENYRIIYVPMVHYGANTDTVACGKLADKVPGWILPELPKPAELRWMAARSEFSISARMHCCLIGFAAGLPSIGLEYQGKFKGAFRTFGLADLAILPDEFSDAFPKAFSQVMTDSGEIRKSILAQLPEVVASARVPVDSALTNVPH